MTITSGLVSNGQFDFALPHAISLAEAGHAVQDKRIGEQFITWTRYVTDSVHEGYSFCGQLMPVDHELQLMLVNTLRKARSITTRPLLVLNYPCRTWKASCYRVFALL
jgi:AP-4 complex subunit epsilon-1